VFLDYLFLIAPSYCVLCTQCCQCFWIIYSWLLLRPVSCVPNVACCQCFLIIYSWLLLRPVSCVSNVASVSGLSILDCSFVLCLVYPLLPVFLDYLLLIVSSVSSNVPYCNILRNNPKCESWLHSSLYVNLVMFQPEPMVMKGKTNKTLYCRNSS
jgi:hypothetical protein